MIEFFSRGDLYFTADAHLSFVCGAADPKGGEPPKFRRQFLDWADKNQRNLVCVRAENAATDLLREVAERHATPNLAKFEDAIAHIVDSLLIFPESPGSFAELGFFSANDEMCKKILVAVLAEHQGNSFIMLGPIRNIGTKSSFAPIPMVLSEPYDSAFQQIADRLLGEGKATRNYRTRFSLKPWKDYGDREKLEILDCIFDILGICTEADVFDFIHKRFGNFDASGVRLLIAMLAALGRIVRNDDADIIRLASAFPPNFIEGADDELTELRAKWNDGYRTHLPEAIKEFAEKNP